MSILKLENCIAVTVSNMLYILNCDWELSKSLLNDLCKGFLTHNLVLMPLKIPGNYLIYEYRCRF